MVEYGFARDGRHTEEIDDVLEAVHSRFGTDARPFLHRVTYLPEANKTVVEIHGGGEHLLHEFWQRPEWIEQDRGSVLFSNHAGHVQLADVSCRGYLRVLDGDRFQQPQGAVRLPLQWLTATMNLARKGAPLKYTGPVYREGVATDDTLCVAISGYHVCVHKNTDYVCVTLIAVTGPCEDEPS